MALRDLRLLRVSLFAVLVVEGVMELLEMRWRGRVSAALVRGGGAVERCTKFCSEPEAMISAESGGLRRGVKKGTQNFA